MELSKLLILLFILSVIPFTFFYGTFIKPLPYRPTDYYANRTISDTFYIDIIKRVNSLAKPNSTVFLLPQTEYPVFTLRKDISWQYYSAEDADIFVVSPLLSIPKDFKYSRIETINGLQDGKNITRYLLIKED